MTQDLVKRVMACKLDAGGYDCPCCGAINAMGGKKQLSRYARRKLKAELKAELED